MENSVTFNFFFYRTPVSDDIDWPLYNESNPIYHVWNAAELHVGYGPRAAECQFWNGFFPKIGKPVLKTNLFVSIRKLIINNN